MAREIVMSMIYYSKQNVATIEQEPWCFVYHIHSFHLTWWGRTSGARFSAPTVCRRLVYARHGRELMGCKSLVLESNHCRETGYTKY
jgi:hypothetical protein